MKDSGQAGYQGLLFLINLLWEIGWGAAGIAMLFLRRWFALPIWCGLGLLCLWVLIALIKTVVIAWSVSVGAKREPPKANRNPYTIRLDFPLPTMERDTASVDEK